MVDFKLFKALALLMHTCSGESKLSPQKKKTTLNYDEGFYKSLLSIVLFVSTVAFGQQPIVTVCVNNIIAAGTANYTATGANGSFLTDNSCNYTFGAATQTAGNAVKAWPAPFTTSLHASYSTEANEDVKIAVTTLNDAAIVSTGSPVKKATIHFNQPGHNQYLLLLTCLP